MKTLTETGFVQTIRQEAMMPQQATGLEDFLTLYDGFTNRLFEITETEGPLDLLHCLCYAKVELHAMCKALARHGDKKKCGLAFCRKSL